MSLFKETRDIIGSQSSRYELATTYTGSGISSAIDISNCSQVLLDVEYTMGASETGNSVEIKVEYANPLAGSPTSTDWYQGVTTSISSGTQTISLQEYTFSAVSAAETYDRFQIPIPVASKFIRVSVKETGVSSNAGSASVRLTRQSEESIN